MRDNLDRVMKGSVESSLEYVQDGASTISWALVQLFDRLCGQHFFLNALSSIKLCTGNIEACFKFETSSAGNY